MTSKRTLVAAACLAALPFAAGAEPASPAPAGVVIDPAAERALLDACSYLRSAERFSVEAEISYDDVLKTGKKVQYSREGKFVVQRPNQLRLDSNSDKGARSFYYDGKTLTVFRPDTRVYAVAEAPATIDALLDDLEKRGVVMPADDLLRAKPCATLVAHLKRGTYAGRHFLDGGWYRHLLLETDAVDVQLWIGEDDEPEIRKLVISYRDAPGAPQYTALLRNWSFAPTIEGATFSFTPPEGVEKVEYRGANPAKGGDK